MRKIFKILYVIFTILILLTSFVTLILGFTGNSYQGQDYLNRNFNLPTEVVQAPNDTGHLYVAEKTGAIYKISNKQGASDAQLFLDLSNVVITGAEDGLLGMAFHPDFPTVSKFYTFHTELQPNSTSTLQTVLSSFDVGSDGIALRSSQQVLIVNKLHSINHRAGKLNFDASGYLLVHIGDDATFVGAQNRTSILGSILRIDVDHPTNASIPYGIPADNPFVDATGVRSEIYAYGFRNPFRGAFDVVTGNYYIADVGSASWEEIDLLKPGANYGWPYYEGSHCRTNCTGETTSSALLNYEHPIADYPHSLTSINHYYDFSLKNRNDIYGAAVIGPNIYRGSEFKEFYGKLLITDYLGLVYSWDLTTGKTNYVTRFPSPIASTHQLLGSHEILYVGQGVFDNSGKIYQLVKRIDWTFIGMIFVNLILIITPIIIKYKKPILSKLGKNNDENMNNQN